MLTIYSKAIRNVMKREFIRIAERKTLYSLMIILPMILFLLFALIYKNRSIENLPVAIFDEDNSALSRLVIQSVESTKSMKIDRYVHSIDEIRESMLSGKIQAGFYIPRDFSSEIKSGKSTRMVVYKNTNNLIIGNLIYKDALTITKTVSGGVLLKKLRSEGMSEDQAMNIVNPIRLETQSLFNPAYNYENYLVPGLMPVMLQMIIMISGVLIISSEYTHRTIDELFKTADNLVLAVFLGKSIPHLLIYTTMSLGMIGIIFPLFAIPYSGSVVTGLLFLIYFIAANFFLAMFLSTLIHDQLLATEIAVFFNTPAFIFSGYTFPLSSMPGLHSIYGQMMPFTHFLSGFLKIYQMNAPNRYLWPEVQVLSLFVWGSIALSLIAIKYRKSHLPALTGGGTV